MNKEREKIILEKILKDKKVYVKKLAKEIYASEPSIRRDLQSLEKQGFIKRIHGGAILEENNTSNMKIPFIIRELEQSNEKLEMAKKASELVNDGYTIMLDGSSSAYNIIPFLTGKRNITIITNGVKALTRAGELGINAYSTGGHLLASCLSLVGEEAHKTIESFNADICFFSCRGLSEEGLLTDISIEEDVARQYMLKNSKTKVFLCNSAKIGKKYMHTLCSVDDIDLIISNVKLPESLPAFEKDFTTSVFSGSGTLE